MNFAKEIATPRARSFWANLIAPIFHKMLDRIDAGLDVGMIEALLPDGTSRRLGGRVPGPAPIVTVHRWRALTRLANGGSVGWYEAWASGDWSSPDPIPLFDLFMRNRVPLGDVARSGGTARVIARTWHHLRRNHKPGARRNIAAHYDLGNDFYQEWLDPGLSYSAAIFDDAGDDLGQAQGRKLQAILARTGVRQSDLILEIGCGWGSFAELAAASGIKVHALTLSAEQKRSVDNRISDAGLCGVETMLMDYRDYRGTVDAVASIEMVEAVGEAYWPAYLDTIVRVLKPGGNAAIQFIVIADDVFAAYAAGVDFIQRYVFPGGMLLSESRFRALAEARDLRWDSPVRFGPDYAETLLRWRRRFDAAVDEGRLPERFDARFIALWRYYLMYCEGGFRGGGIDVLQVTLKKNR